MVGVLEKVQTSEHDAPTYCDIMVYWYAFAMVLLTTLVVISKFFFYVSLWIIHDKMEDSGKFAKT